MEADTAGPLREMWYYAVPSDRLRAGRTMAKTMLGEPLLLGRAETGAVFALRDICPHRGIPLSDGSFDGAEVECCYHGWRFDTDGRCTTIPSLTADQTFDVGRIRVKSYPVREVQGNVWVFFGTGQGDAPDVPEVPVLPAIGNRRPDLVASMRVPCSVDHAVVGLMDPAHGPFVHRAFWWRSRGSIHEKAKAFAPSPFGFTMLRHAPSKNSRAYRLLGGKRETEIVFRLPGIRIEHIRAGRHTLVNLTAVTPLTADETEVTNAIYWTVPWLAPLKPLARYLARTFLEQDRAIMVKQRVGLQYDPTLMLINDADTQAKWYYRLKNEYARARAEGRDFVHPVQERTLRWRS